MCPIACLAPFDFDFTVELLCSKIAPDLAGAAENGHAVVGVVVNSDVRFDIVMARRAWRDLQGLEF
jgi:hypothetical protein